MLLQCGWAGGIGRDGRRRSHLEAAKNGITRISTERILLTPIPVRRLGGTTFRSGASIYRPLIADTDLTHHFRSGRASYFRRALS